MTPKRCLKKWARLPNLGLKKLAMAPELGQKGGNGSRIGRNKQSKHSRIWTKKKAMTPIYGP